MAFFLRINEIKSYAWVSECASVCPCLSDTHDSHFFVACLFWNNSYTFSFGVRVWSIALLICADFFFCHSIQIQYNNSYSFTIAVKNERIINFHLLLWMIVLKAFPCWQSYGCFVFVIDPVAFGRTSNEWIGWNAHLSSSSSAFCLCQLWFCYLFFKSSVSLCTIHFSLCWMFINYVCLASDVYVHGNRTSSMLQHVHFFQFVN